MNLEPVQYRQAGVHARMTNFQGITVMSSLSSRICRGIISSVNVFDRNGKTVEEVREKLDRYSRLLRVPRGVRIEPVLAGSVSGEWIVPAGAPPGKAILYIHGGGWAICSTKTHRAMVARLAIASRVRALSIDYRLAPEHPFPAGLEDCLEAYLWLLDQGFHQGEIVIAGDSAGGNLTLATMLALKEAGEPLPAGAVCISPATDLLGTGESFRTKAGIDPMLKIPEGGYDLRPYCGENDPRNPLISPLYGDLSGLPPILIHIGEDEVLLDDSTRFVERACEVGVDARVVVWKEMWHVFQIFAPFLPEARQSIHEMGEFIQAVLK